MNKHFWLIQRGSFKQLDGTEFFGSNTNCLIYPDYMGSAEFEFGAIPRAYHRLMGHFTEYKCYTTDITNVRGVPFHLICRESEYEDIRAELQRYIDKPYQLKEWTNLHAHLKEDSDSYETYRRKTNFWWCIDRGFIGDWILFLGADDRKNALTQILDNDYENWWLTMPEEERQDLLKQAERR